MLAPIQARARDWGPPSEYGWRVLVVCVLCNQTQGSRAEPVARAIFARWPTPAALAVAPLGEVADLVRPLGLVRRAGVLRELSEAWDRLPLEVHSGTPCPRCGGRSTQSMSERSVYCSACRRTGQTRGERVVDAGLPGVGSYAVEAYRLFVEGRDLVPADRVLRSWVLSQNLRPHSRSDDTLKPGQPTTITTTTKGADMATKNDQTTTTPTEALRDNVTGAIERGDAEPIVAVESIGTDSVFTLLVGSGLPGVGPAIASKALDDSEIDHQAPATAEQRARAKSRTEGTEKSGLRGRALALWVLTGETRGNGSTKASDERKARAATADKPKAAKASTSTAGRRSTYPAEITEAVRLAKAARGTTNGAPGAKQHVLVRETLAAAGVADVPAILKAAGVKSEKALRSIADGSASTEDVKALRPLGQTIPDPFCKGRNLASMLVALVDQTKKAAKS